MFKEIQKWFRSRPKLQVPPPVQVIAPLSQEDLEAVINHAISILTKSIHIYIRSPQSTPITTGMPYTHVANVLLAETIAQLGFSDLYPGDVAHIGRSLGTMLNQLYDRPNVDIGDFDSRVIVFIPLGPADTPINLMTVVHSPINDAERMFEAEILSDLTYDISDAINRFIKGQCRIVRYGTGKGQDNVVSTANNISGFKITLQDVQTIFKGILP